MIPATAGHRALGLMFVLAVLVLCFLFLNLVLAVVYNAVSYTHLTLPTICSV